MKRIVKNAIVLSVYHIARGTVLKIEEEMRRENKDSKDFKNKLLIMSTVHSLLGIIYNE